MNKNPATKRFRVTMIALTICMLIFAFAHSSMPASVSAEESGGVLDFLLNIFKALGINAELTDHIIRKLAHFTEYTAIGMLLLSCAYSFDRIKPLRYYSQVLFCGLSAAVCDETIQLNVVGRSGQITDVLLDFSGVIFGAALMLVFYTLYKRIRKIM